MNGTDGVVRRRTSQVRRCLAPRRQFALTILRSGHPMLRRVGGRNFVPSSQRLRGLTTGRPATDGLRALCNAFNVSLPIVRTRPTVGGAGRPRLKLWAFGGRRCICEAGCQLYQYKYPTRRRQGEVRLPYVRRMRRHRRQKASPVNVLLHGLQRWNL